MIETSQSQSTENASEVKGLRSETISFASHIALVLSIPGPLLLLLSYLPLGGMKSVLLVAGFYLGIILNSIGSVLGVISIFRLRGIVAILLALVFWVLVFSYVVRDEFRV